MGFFRYMLTGKKSKRKSSSSSRHVKKNHTRVAVVPYKGRNGGTFWEIIVGKKPKGYDNRTRAYGFSTKEDAISMARKDKGRRVYF